MAKHEKCRHCDRTIFFSTPRGMYIHYETCEPECGLRADPVRSERGFIGRGWTP